MENLARPGRLSTLAAAFVVARRDFVAILWSRSFIFFLLGPLFPLVVFGLAGTVGSRLDAAADHPVIGIVMPAADADALLAADSALGPKLGGVLPDLVVLRRLAPSERADPAAALRMGLAGHHLGSLAAVASGTLATPVLTGTKAAIADWAGPLSLVAARAGGEGPARIPAVRLAPTAASTAHQQRRGEMVVAQAAQVVLFMMVMLLAGMVLSNFVEEKGNKIIEILAAAIPMDAVFLGKLFAMLAVSLVGITTWGAVVAAVLLGGGHSLGDLPTPAVGWPAFAALAVAYFAMAYLLIGAVFLAIGSQAATVREVQTLNMPASMGQILVFFLASFALSQPGKPIEWVAMLVPFSSPYAMLARAALRPEIWPHLAALAWQALCVAGFIRVGARLFRARVMKSGPAPAKREKLSPPRATA